MHFYKDERNASISQINLRFIARGSQAIHPSVIYVMDEDIAPLKVISTKPKHKF